MNCHCGKHVVKKLQKPSFHYSLLPRTPVLCMPAQAANHAREGATCRRVVQQTFGLDSLLVNCDSHSSICCVCRTFRKVEDLVLDPEKSAGESVILASGAE